MKPCVDLSRLPEDRIWVELRKHACEGVRFHLYHEEGHEMDSRSKEYRIELVVGGSAFFEPHVWATSAALAAEEASEMEDAADPTVCHQCSQRVGDLGVTAVIATNVQDDEDTFTLEV